MLLRRPAPGKLVTSVRFAKRNGRGREGDRADRQPVQRSKARVGHGVNRFRLISARQEVEIFRLDSHLT
jgi:hypothetical protein